MRIMAFVLVLAAFGCANKCDFNKDGIVDEANDIAALQAAFGSDNPKFDLDGDGVVGGTDYGICAEEIRKQAL